MNEQEVITLDDLNIERDPGTEWHPEKAEAWDGDCLRNISDEEMEEHLSKPEREDYPDGYALLAAEDSRYAPKGAV